MKRPVLLALGLLVTFMAPYVGAQSLDRTIYDRRVCQAHIEITTSLSGDGGGTVYQRVTNDSTGGIGVFVAIRSAPLLREWLASVRDVGAGRVASSGLFTLGPEGCTLEMLRAANGSSMVAECMTPPVYEKVRVCMTRIQLNDYLAAMDRGLAFLRAHPSD